MVDRNLIKAWVIKRNFVLRNTIRTTLCDVYRPFS